MAGGAGFGWLCIVTPAAVVALVNAFAVAVVATVRCGVTI